jgi:uridine phosphorylase
MSMPNFTKLSGTAVIEPTGVIKERNEAGLQPSTPVPEGAIICYDSTLWKLVSTLPNRIECDGWLKGSYLLQRNNSMVLVSKAAGFGAPTAVMTLEELAAYGITKFINVGTAGGLQKDMNVGDIVVCESAIRDEGTSHHYLRSEKYAHAGKELTTDLCNALEKRGICFRKGISWTTDAPYRETIEELQKFRSEGVLTVEMEASALFAVGAFRGLSACSVFTISDILTEEGWKQGYHSDEKNEGLKWIFEVAEEVLLKGL